MALSVISNMSTSLASKLLQGPLRKQAAVAAVISSRGTATCQMSSISGRHNPLDITRETNPMLHQEDSRTESEAGAFEVKVPGDVSYTTWTCTSMPSCMCASKQQVLMMVLMGLAIYTTASLLLVLIQLRMS